MEKELYDEYQITDFTTGRTAFFRVLKGSPKEAVTAAFERAWKELETMRKEPKPDTTRELPKTSSIDAWCHRLTGSDVGGWMLEVRGNCIHYENDGKYVVRMFKKQSDIPIPSSDKDRLKELEKEFNKKFEYLETNEGMTGLSVEEYHKPANKRVWNWILSHAKELGELV